MRITIDLIPWGIEDRKRELCRAEIWNDGTGTTEMRNYKYRLSKFHRPSDNWKSGRITGFVPRTQGAWDLLMLVFRAALKGRKALTCDVPDAWDESGEFVAANAESEARHDPTGYFEPNGEATAPRHKNVSAQGDAAKQLINRGGEPEWITG